jgi:cell division protein FtsW
MVFSTTAVVSAKYYDDSTAMIKRHLFYVVLGLIAFWVFSRVTLEWLRKLALGLLIIAIVSLVAVLIPGIGYVAGGARRWIALGPIRFQPGEFIKLIVVVYMATYIGRHSERMVELNTGVIVPFALIGGISALLLLQPDFGTTVVIFSVVFCQLFLFTRLRHLVGLAAVGGLAMAALVIASPYRMKRFLSFTDPLQDASASGYQLVQSLIAITSGGLTGTGLGAGKQKLFYLPAAHTDFIYAVIAEELGLIGAIVVLLLFLFIAYRGLKLATKHLSRPYIASLTVGCTMVIVIPAFFNFAVVLGLLPTKGLVLPLVAYGGSAMIVHLAIAGVLVKISKLEH